MNEVFHQPAAFLAMVYGGMLAGIALDMLRIPRRLLRMRAVTAIADALFVLCAAALFALSLLWATGGAVRPYAAVGYALGLLLQQVSVSYLFFRFFHQILSKIKK